MATEDKQKQRQIQRFWLRQNDEQRQMQKQIPRLRLGMTKEQKQIPRNDKDDLTAVSSSAHSCHLKTATGDACTGAAGLL
jgi:hypothetical protein